MSSPSAPLSRGPVSGVPLIEGVRRAIRVRHYSRRTEDAYVQWIKRYIVHHGKRHPLDMGRGEVVAFLTMLAVDRRMSASSQNQALSALLFLYKVVLEREIGPIEALPRARTPDRVPVVLSVDEVRQVLEEMTGTTGLIASILYGAGLRLQECLALRIKDLDFDRGEIVVRRGKGQKDRRVMLPLSLREPLRRHLATVREVHERDLTVGEGRVVMPDALDRKFPNAATSWLWQFVFPAARICRDPRYGPSTRYHLHESVVQRAVTIAARRAGIAKRVSCHTFRHHADSRIMPMAADAPLVVAEIARFQTARSA